MIISNIRSDFVRYLITYLNSNFIHQLDNLSFFNSYIDVLTRDIVH
jgi:hypothetical protein